MGTYWKSKVLPKIKKVFENPKKASAVESCKTFDESKEEYAKEFEEKKTELQPKVVEIYEASSVEIKALVKEPKDSGLKKHSAAVQKFLDELVKIEFPGSKAVSEASSKSGPVYVKGPISFVFEKVSTFIVVEEKAVEPAAAETVVAPGAGEESSSKEEIVVEGEKKEGEVVAVAEPSAAVEPATEAPPATTV